MLVLGVNFKWGDLSSVPKKFSAEHEMFTLTQGCDSGVSKYAFGHILSQNASKREGTTK